MCVSLNLIVVLISVALEVGANESWLGILAARLSFIGTAGTVTKGVETCL